MACHTVYTRGRHAKDFPTWECLTAQDATRPIYFQIVQIYSYQQALHERARARAASSRRLQLPNSTEQAHHFNLYIRVPSLIRLIGWHPALFSASKYVIVILQG